MWTCITQRKMQNSYRRCWWDILQHRRKIVNNRGERLCLDSIPMKVRANEDSLSRNIPKKSSFHCVFWGEGLASPKQCTHVQILHVEIRFFALIFDSLAPLSWHFCQIQPWSAMPPRVIWMQNKNLPIPPFAWHLKAIFIWTLNLLNLQLQILRYAPYRTSAIKKTPRTLGGIVSITVVHKIFYRKMKINETTHSHPRREENDAYIHARSPVSIWDGMHNRITYTRSCKPFYSCFGQCRCYINSKKTRTIFNIIW